MGILFFFIPFVFIVKLDDMIFFQSNMQIILSLFSIKSLKLKCYLFQRECAAFFIALTLKTIECLSNSQLFPPTPHCTLSIVHFVHTKTVNMAIKPIAVVE